MDQFPIFDLAAPDRPTRISARPPLGDSARALQRAHPAAGSYTVGDEDVLMELSDVDIFPRLRG